MSLCMTRVSKFCLKCKVEAVSCLINKVVLQIVKNGIGNYLKLRRANQIGFFIATKHLPLKYRVFSSYSISCRNLCIFTFLLRKAKRSEPCQTRMKRVLKTPSWGIMHKKWSFPLRISSVNVTKSAVFLVQSGNWLGSSKIFVAFFILINIFFLSWFFILIFLSFFLSWFLSWSFLSWFFLSPLPIMELNNCCWEWSEGVHMNKLKCSLEALFLVKKQNSF